MKLENKTTITTRTILYSLGIGSDEYSHKHRMERNEKKKKKKREDKKEDRRKNKNGRKERTKR